MVCLNEIPPEITFHFLLGLDPLLIKELRTLCKTIYLAVTTDSFAVENLKRLYPISESYPFIPKYPISVYQTRHCRLGREFFYWDRFHQRQLPKVVEDARFPGVGVDEERPQWLRIPKKPEFWTAYEMNFALPPDAPAADRIHAPLPRCWFRNVLGIYLDNNAFYGPIPVELCVSIGPHCRMTTSRIISMSGNQLTGPIPPELGGYSHTLYTLDLSNNKLEGCIPPELVNLTGLRNLDLSDNRLEGSIPEQFFGSLFELHLARNRLSGPLSSTRVFPDLNPSLRVLDLSGNDLEGEVPGWLGCLWKLQCLDLSDNHFSGLIPEELCNDLRYISEINLARNQLHGTVPRSLDNLADHLLIFDVSCNNIEGELPTCMQTAMVKIIDWRFERDWAGYFASWLFTDDCEDSSWEY